MAAGEEVDVQELALLYTGLAFEMAAKPLTMLLRHVAVVEFNRAKAASPPTQVLSFR